MKTSKQTEVENKKKQKLSTQAKIFFYFLRDYENTTTLSKKLKMSEPRVSYHVKTLHLYDDCDVKKIKGKSGIRNTSNRYKGHKKTKYQQKNMKVYRFKIDELFLDHYNEHKLSKLSGRSKKILYILLEPDFARKSVFDNIDDVNNIDDIKNKLYDFIDNFLWNFQNDLLNKRNLNNVFNFDEFINLENKEISDRLLKNINEPENSPIEYRVSFFDFKFLAELITKFYSKVYIQLLYERLISLVGHINENDKLILKSQDAFSLKIKNFLLEIDKVYDFGKIEIDY